MTGLASVAKGLGKGKEEGEKGDAGRWRQNLANRVVQPPYDDNEAVHLLRKAKCFNLGTVFSNAGDSHTAKELYEWYCSQEIIAVKRSHGAANQVRQVAARERYAQTGRYGFGRGRSAAGDDKGGKGWKGQKGGKSGKGGKNW